MDSETNPDTQTSNKINHLISFAREDENCPKVNQGRCLLLAYASKWMLLLLNFQAVDHMWDICFNTIWAQNWNAIRQIRVFDLKSNLLQYIDRLVGGRTHFIYSSNDFSLQCEYTFEIEWGNLKCEFDDDSISRWKFLWIKEKKNRKKISCRRSRCFRP